MQTKWVRGPSGAVIAQEYLEETARHEAELELMLVLKDELDSYTRELKQIDPDLSLVWAPETVTAPGLAPGRFHVVRRNAPPAPPTLIPLETADGGFKEPGAWMYDMLRKADLWSNRAQADRDKAKQGLERARQRRKQDERDELIWEIDTRLRAKENPGVLFGDSPWTLRAGAPKAA